MRSRKDLDKSLFNPKTTKARTKCELSKCGGVLGLRSRRDLSKSRFLAMCLVLKYVDSISLSQQCQLLAFFMHFIWRFHAKAEMRPHIVIDTD